MCVCVRVLKELQTYSAAVIISGITRESPKEKLQNESLFSWKVV